MSDLVYKQLVEKARSLVKQRETLKYEIAKIANEACVIKYGGPVGKEDYTVTKFANDIGVNPNTLHRWRREYSLVISKIQESGKVNRKALENTLKRVGRETDKKEVSRIYQAEKEKLKTPEDYQFADIIKRLKNIDFAINHSLVLSKINKDDIRLGLEISEKIYMGLKNFSNGKVIKSRSRQKALEMVSALAQQ
jgi:transposase-like protein